MDVSECDAEEAAEVVQKGIKDLILRRFFTRAWILQEFVLNPQMCFIVGDSTYMLPADNILLHLWRCMVEMDQSEDVFFSEHFNDKESNMYHLAIIMTHLRTVQEWYPSRRASKPNYSDIVKLACRLDATVEQDKVYRCLALADKSFRDRFEIDYTESLETLSQRIVHALIDHEQSVNILRQAKLHHAESYQCSWSLHMSDMAVAKTDPQIYLVARKTFSASANTSQIHPLWPASNPNILSLAGYIVDRADLIMPGLDEYRTAYHMVQAFNHTLASKASKESSETDAFWRTIIKDEVTPNFSGGYFGRARPYHAAYYLCWLCVMQEKEELLYTESLRQSVGHFADICERMAARSKDQRLCITAKGRLAYIPEAAEPADEFVIFRGGDVPFIVRPDRDDFRLIGEWYLHGVMDGEALIGAGEPSRIALV